MAQAIAAGVSRGVLSNEAGLGSAPMAHGVADVPFREHPLDQFLEEADRFELLNATHSSVAAPDEVTDFNGAEGDKIVMELAAFRPTRPTGSFRCWLRAVARTKIADHFRRRPGSKQMLAQQRFGQQIVLRDSRGLDLALAAAFFCDGFINLHREPLPGPLVCRRAGLLYGRLAILAGLLGRHGRGRARVPRVGPDEPREPRQHSRVRVPVLPRRLLGMRWALVIARRAVGAVVALAALSALIFAATEVLPGDAVGVLAGADATAQERRQLAAGLGLDRPPVERYLAWVAGAVRGDLGTGYVGGREVATVTWIGAMLGAALAFALARRYGRPLVDRLVARHDQRQHGLVDPGPGVDEEVIWGCSPTYWTC